MRDFLDKNYTDEAKVQKPKADFGGWKPGQATDTSSQDDQFEDQTDADQFEDQTDAEPGMLPPPPLRKDTIGMAVSKLGMRPPPRLEARDSSLPPGGQFENQNNDDEGYDGEFEDQTDAFENQTDEFEN